MHRRSFLLSTLALAACVAGPSPAPLPANDPSLSPQPNPAFDAWVTAFRERAAAQGITRDTLDRAFRGAGFLPGVIARDANQTEFTRTLEDYLNIVAPEARVSEGRQAVAARRGTLAAIEARYGVPAAVLGAIWGVESRFGTRRGDIPVVSATATLAFDGRRGRFFEANLLEALRILQRGDTTPDRLVGSWAGAMGHTQMIPTTYATQAVDFDGDGRRDVWSDDPTDALASTANFLANAGWRRGAPWLIEASLPAGFDAGLTGRDRRRGAAAWRGMGVRAASGAALPDGDIAILAPMGVGRPAFAVYPNFDRFLRYNPSELYGLGVGYLATRLDGAGPLVASFGPDETGLTLADRQALQAGLNRAGFDAGTPDGVIGARTRGAIQAFQRSRGLAVTGVPSRELLRQLQ